MIARWEEKVYRKSWVERCRSDVTGRPRVRIVWIRRRNTGGCLPGLVLARVFSSLAECCHHNGVVELQRIVWQHLPRISKLLYHKFVFNICKLFQWCFSFCPFSSFQSGACFHIVVYIVRKCRHEADRHVVLILLVRYLVLAKNASDQMELSHWDLLFFTAIFNSVIFVPFTAFEVRLVATANGIIEGWFTFVVNQSD